MNGSPQIYETTELTIPVQGSQQNAVLTAENQQIPQADTSRVVGRPFQKGQSGNPKGFNHVLRSNC
jgi:hypothetical protein